jgi:hypothetical protein
MNRGQCVGVRISISRTRTRMARSRAETHYKSIFNRVPHRQASRLVSGKSHASSVTSRLRIGPRSNGRAGP